MKREYRTYDFELRKAEDGKPKIEGYSAVFDQLSDDLGGFREKIDKGAFAKTITEDDVRALFNHDSNHVLGRNKNGTLKLAEDEHGLKVEIDPPDTQFANDLLKQIERGDINQMSFGFVTRVDEWDEKDKEDVSPVTFPAYPQTSVSVKSTDEIYQEFRQSLEVKEKEQEKQNESKNRFKKMLQKLHVELIKKGIKPN